MINKIESSKIDAVYTNAMNVSKAITRAMLDYGHLLPSEVSSQLLEAVEQLADALEALQDG